MNEAAPTIELEAQQAVCFHEDQLPTYIADGTSSEVRDGYVDRKLCMVDDAREVTATLHSYRPGAGFNSPMHFHHFPHVRYVVSGTMRIGKEMLAAGDCVFHPEYIAYDIGEGRGELPHFLQIDYMGYSSFPMLVGTRRWGDALTELSKRGTIKGGIYLPDNGPKQSLEAAAAEQITGKKFQRGKPLMQNPLTIHTRELPWVNHAKGVSVKHIVYASAVGPNIKLVKLDKGAVLPAGHSNCQQARYVLEGGITWGDQKYDSVSMMFYPPNNDYPETKSEADGTTLFVVQWANVGQESPPFAVL